MTDSRIITYSGVDYERQHDGLDYWRECDALKEQPVKTLAEIEQELEDAER